MHRYGLFATFGLDMLDHSIMQKNLNYNESQTVTNSRIQTHPCEVGSRGMTWVVWKKSELVT